MDSIYTPEEQRLIDVWEGTFAVSSRTAMPPRCRRCPRTIMWIMSHGHSPSKRDA